MNLCKHLIGLDFLIHGNVCFTSGEKWNLFRPISADYLVVKVPHMADSISEGTLKEWNKKLGEFVKADEEVTRIETDKIDVAVNSPKSGIIVEHFSNPDDTVVVGANLFKLELKEEDPTKDTAPPTQEKKPAAPPSEPSPPSASTPKSTPAPSSFTTPPPTTPPSSTSTPSSSPPSSPTSPTPASVPPTVSSPASSTSSRTEEKVKMTRMRLRIAERLKASQNTAASLTTFNEIDMSTLLHLRSKHSPRFQEKHGIKLGFLSFFIQASHHALQHVPVINARIENDHVVYPSYFDVSVAVATEKGLVTPVLRDCQSKSLSQLELGLSQLAQLARKNQLALEDMAGGTFTISNGGVFGSLFGTPILNLPQSAILGMHAIKERPCVVDGKIEIRPMMYVCLTYDHRLIDGREAVTFLVKLKEALEDPMHLLIQ
ncbi:2-oxoglutarate dehydrogenase complex E2 component [Coelomomyces lativittatus]|nr:2-oxoglutarate dehydrogenase complex E2 component [Coelomomyces lativittatus]